MLVVIVPMLVLVAIKSLWNFFALSLAIAKEGEPSVDTEVPQQGGLSLMVVEPLILAIAALLGFSQSPTFAAATALVGGAVIAASYALGIAVGVLVRGVRRRRHRG